jgi:hypothetical protein
MIIVIYLTVRLEVLTTVVMNSIISGDDGGDAFLRNIGLLSKHYTASHSGRYYSTYYIVKMAAGLLKLVLLFILIIKQTFVILSKF